MTNDQIKIVPSTAAELEQALKKRALELKENKDSYGSILALYLCTYLANYLSEHKDELSLTRIEGDELTGLFIRAFDDLANRANDTAVAFVEKYEALVREYHEEEWLYRTPLFAKVESGWSDTSDILFITKVLFQVIFAGKPPVDFSTLESERKVVSLRFQRLLNKIWPKVKQKIEEAAGKPCLGVFGHTRLMAYKNDRHYVFVVSDLYNGAANIHFQVSSKSKEAYGAKMVGCLVDLVPALQMLEEIADNFEVDDLYPQQN